ncbi:MAG TPA: DUF2239 family protein [Planctomycetaceae bacterium]|nr:DUF2239 family protein [Planctomycetaceae bacterium]
MQKTEQFIAFDGMIRLCEGTIPQVTKAVSLKLDVCPTASILVFNRSTGQQTDIHLRATADVVASDVASQSVGPGRPRLGVVGREVTLLPRHWEWLNSQPSGASVALRKLVESAMRENHDKDSVRLRQEAAYKFMSAIAGNLAGYEEALRSLFANDRDGFFDQLQDWPAEVRQFAMDLAFPSQAEQSAGLPHRAVAVSHCDKA